MAAATNTNTRALPIGHVPCTDLKPSDRRALVAARDGTRVSVRDVWSLESQGLVTSSSKGWELTGVGREIAALQ